MELIKYLYIGKKSRYLGDIFDFINRDGICFYRAAPIVEINHIKYNVQDIPNLLPESYQKFLSEFSSIIMSNDRMVNVSNKRISYLHFMRILYDVYNSIIPLDFVKDDIKALNDMLKFYSIELTYYEIKELNYIRFNSGFPWFDIKKLEFKGEESFAYQVFDKLILLNKKIKKYINPNAEVNLPEKKLEALPEIKSPPPLETSSEQSNLYVIIPVIVVAVLIYKWLYM
jgi:hypothetical protein